METRTWLDELIRANLTPRAESIMAEIHGLPEPEYEDVPDTEIALWMLASWATFGRSRLGDKVITLCR